MTNLTLHAQWLPQQGIGLWLGQGNEALADLCDDEKTRALEEFGLYGKKFRNYGTWKLLEGKTLTDHTMPLALVSLKEFSELSEDVAFHEALADPEHNSAQGTALSGELIWLSHLVEGLRSVIEAGKVTFRPHMVNNQWYLRWIPLASADVEQWLSPFQAAVPPVFSLNNPSMLLGQEIVNELTNTLVRDTLQAADAQGLMPAQASPMISPLIYDEPHVRKGSVFSAAMDSWHDTVPVNEQELAFVFTELADGSAGGSQSDQPADPYWWIQLDLGIPESIVATPINVYSVSDAQRELVSKTWSRALAVWKPLADLAKPISTWLQTGLWVGDPRTANHEQIRNNRLGFFIDAQHMGDFLDVGLPTLESQGIRVVVPKGWLTPQKLKPVLQVTQSGTSQGLGLETINKFSWDISLGDEKLTQDEAARLLRSSSSIVEVNNRFVRLDSGSVEVMKQHMDTIARFQNLVHKVTEDNATETELQEFDDLSSMFSGEISVASLISAQQDILAQDLEDGYGPGDGLPIQAQGWVQNLLHPDGAGIEPPRHINQPAELHAELYEHQRTGLDWLVWLVEHNLGGILADDMGVGKTIQTIGLLLWMKDNDYLDQPALIVAPKSVVGVWEKELATRAPSLRVHTEHGSSKIPVEQFAMKTDDYDVVLSTYGTIQTQAEKFASRHWSILVADEAQAIKNRDTQAAKALRSIPVAHRIVLTGTPLENHLKELYAHMDFVNPGILGSAKAFNTRIAHPIEFHGDEEVTGRLKRLLSPFILRRLKSDPEVGLELPEKNETVVKATLTPEQASLYQAVLNQLTEKLAASPGNSFTHIATALTNFQLICSHPMYYTNDAKGALDNGQSRSGKLEVLVDMLDRFVPAGRSTLIFNRYPGKFKMLLPYLENRYGTEIPIFDGTLSTGRRKKVIEEFQSGALPILVLGVRAGGTGITLTKAQEVIHFDRWLNPAVEDQATDRAHRIGQSSEVNVYKLVTQGTIEEGVDDMLNNKRELADLVVGTKTDVFTDLTNEEFLEFAALQQSATQRVQSANTHAEHAFTPEPLGSDISGGEVSNE